jgi:hypothetical protein
VARPEDAARTGATPPGLPGEPIERRAKRILRQLGREHLDRDLAIEFRVDRPIHLAHAAGAEPLRMVAWW